MGKIIYSLVYNRKKCLNRKGTALVQVEAYLERRKKYFSTRVYLRPEQWDVRKSVVKNHPNADALNRLLYEFVADIEKKELDLWQKGKRISLELLKTTVTGDCSDGSFTDFFRQEVLEAPLKESTRRNHLSTLALLCQFQRNVAFGDVTFEFVTGFEAFLRARGYHTNTVAKHLKHLKRAVNLAINKDYMEVQKYAFRKYRIKTVESRHTYLSPEELHCLENLQLDAGEQRWQQTLDAFLFCCYAGLRYSDFANLSADNLVCIRQKTWLVYRSVKTRVEVRLPLYLLFEGKALQILGKYQNGLESFFRLKDNSNVNKELAVIAARAGLKKHLSFHAARHTNATLLIYNGVNITTVQKLLGHKSVKTTQGYAGIMDVTIVHDLEKVGDRKLRNRKS